MLIIGGNNSPCVLPVPGRPNRIEMARPQPAMCQKNSAILLVSDHFSAQWLVGALSQLCVKEKVDKFDSDCKSEKCICRFFRILL
jgi:hypothetical protein